MAYSERISSGEHPIPRARPRPIVDVRTAGFAGAQPIEKASIDTASLATSSGAALFERHVIVFHEGDSGDRLYEVVSGGIMLYKLLPDGRRQIIEVLRPGDLFGIGTNGRRSATAETLTTTRLKVIEHAELNASKELQQTLNAKLRAQICALQDHVLLLGRKSAVERVASFLIELIPGRGEEECIGPAGDGEDRSDIMLNMTRQEIADYLGLTIETVSRVISDMRRKGILRIERQDGIVISQVCGLCRLTGFH